MILSLVKKEVHLQRSNILFALAVILIWCLDFLIVFLGDRPLGSKIITTGKLTQIIHYLFVLPCLIVIFPMMIGATSVAQERKLGTFDFQSLLPVSRRMKWIAKTGVAVFLAFFLGGILAEILDGFIVMILQVEKIRPIFGWENELFAPLRFRDLHIGIFSIVFCSSGIYISSLSREPFRVLLLGAIPVLFIVVIQRVVDPSMMLIPHWDSDIFPSRYLFPFIHYLEFTLFSVSPEAKCLWETIDLEKDVLLYENDPYVMNMDAWSDDILLLWGKRNLWKLDLREYFSKRKLDLTSINEKH